MSCFYFLGKILKDAKKHSEPDGKVRALLLYHQVLYGDLWNGDVDVVLINISFIQLSEHDVT